MLKEKEGRMLVIAEEGMAGRRTNPPSRDINLRFLSILRHKTRYGVQESEIRDIKRYGYPTESSTTRRMISRDLTASSANLWEESRQTTPVRRTITNQTFAATDQALLQVDLYWSVFSVCGTAAQPFKILTNNMRACNLSGP